MQFYEGHKGHRNTTRESRGIRHSLISKRERRGPTVLWLQAHIRSYLAVLIEGRMDGGHWLFCILQLTDFRTFSELKDEKARMHNVHPKLFFILQLIDFSAEG